MSQVLHQIKVFLFDFQGVLVKENTYLEDPQLQESYDEFMSNLEPYPSSHDKKNIANDLTQVYRGVKKSFSDYKSKMQDV
jgi:hypothetical protein